MAKTSTSVRDHLARLAAVCRESGLRVTPQRMAVYREVVRSEEHPDVETVANRVRREMPTLSLDTVYRALSVLEEAGLVSRVETLSGPARYDANTEPHHHYVCTRCGLVRDFRSDELDDFSPPREVIPWGTVDSVRVQVRGTCTRCKAAGMGRRSRSDSPGV